MITFRRNWDRPCLLGWEGALITKTTLKGEGSYWKGALIGRESLLRRGTNWNVRALIKKALEGRAYQKGSVYWKEGAKSNHYGKVHIPSSQGIICLRYCGRHLFCSDPMVVLSL